MASTFVQWGACVEAVVVIRKRRFPNLTTEETIKLATEIVQATLAAHLHGEGSD